MTSAHRLTAAAAGAVLATACAADSSSDGAIPFDCPGDPVAPGLNRLTVAGAARLFHAAFPLHASRPPGVLFAFHGFGDSMEAFVDVGLDPDAAPDAPVIVITPDDSGVPPPAGLDWDIARGTEADDNADIAFAEAILGCLAAGETIDTGRIHAFGFSAGAVMANLLHARHPTLISAVVAMSGAWFNDPAQADLVTLVNIDWRWPPLAPADGGAVLVTHGGPADVAALDVIDLEAAAQAAIPFLTAAGRVVLDCPHDRGHALHPTLSAADIAAFPLYLSGDLPLPAGCTLHLP